MAEGLAVLLSVSLSGACLMAAAEGISRLLGRRISPGIRRILWMVVLVRLLCPWSPSGGLLDRAAELPETAWSSSVRTAAEGAAEETQVSHAAAADPSTELPLEAGLTALWGAGLCGVMVRRGVGYARLCRGLSRTQRPAGALPQAVYARLTAEERHPPALLVSGAAPCPMLLGLVRPKIVLPDGKLSQEELEGVLAHELTHWRRRDLWLKWLAALAAAVHWFDPAAWLLLDRLDRDCELSCDQAVVRGWSGPQRARYGELLLRLAAGEELPSIALFSQKQRLKERLISIMEERNDGRKAAVLGAAACLALVLTSTALGVYTGPAAVGEAITGLSSAAGAEVTPAVLSWPVEAGDTVELSSLFTGRIHPITGEQREHSGIDIPQPAGTPVLAAADGTVLETDFSAEDGNYIRLRHGNVTTKYAHLQEYTVEPGQTVSAGEQIGQVGSTGMSTGAHLHFEVTVDGIRVDPLTRLDSQVAVVMPGIPVIE